MKKLNEKNAVVLLSGGQDSTTCLLWALKKFDKIYTLSFNYGQKHKIELECALQVAEKFNLHHKVLNIDTFKAIGDSALVNDGDVNQMKDGLPTSFVPGRNLILLTFAASYAYKMDCGNIVTGVCETDYSGYPDCRQSTMELLEVTLDLGLEAYVKLHTPLMYLTKSQTWQLAQDSYSQGAKIIIEMTHTCYNGDPSTKNSWGYGCGKCPACVIREKGFNEWLESKRGIKWDCKKEEK